MTKICRKWITLRNGKRIFAKDYGKDAFCFYVDKVYAKKKKVKKEPVPEITDSLTE